MSIPPRLFIPRNVASPDLGMTMLFRALVVQHLLGGPRTLWIVLWTIIGLLLCAAVYDFFTAKPMDLDRIYAAFGYRRPGT